MLGLFFFWAGLTAVAAFFLAVVLLGMGLMAATGRGRVLLARAQGGALALLLVFAGLCAALLRARLEPWIAGPPPVAASALIAAQRETMSLLLLGLALGVNALLAGMAWVLLGQSGNALRCAVWALPALKLVLGCVAVLGAFEGGAAGFAETFDGAQHSLLTFSAAAAVLVLLSWPLGALLRRFAGASSTP
jgi:hypothetical protein